MSDQDPRPENVVLRHADGTCTPIELADRGVRSDGVHLWAILTPMAAGDRLTVGRLPAHSAIEIPTASDREAS